MAERPIATQDSASTSSAFEKGTSTAPFLLPAVAVPRGEEFVTLEEFSPQQLDSMSVADRQKRYQKLLGPFEDFLRESAQRNVMPPQLVAAVILNELNDIKSFDLIGERTASGSIGIAQIQVQTARQFGLVDEAPLGALKNAPSAAAAAAIAESFRAENRLRQPKFAIEAAARLIRHLIGEMTRNRDKPWQKLHGFALPNLRDLKSPQELYRFMGPGDAVVVEMRSAQLVAAAYNSPDIVIATRPESVDEDSPAFIYRDATTHGANAAQVAEDLAAPPTLFH